jgi:hypothetical protein
MVFVDFNMELQAAPIAKLGARKMESYRLPFCAVALWLSSGSCDCGGAPGIRAGNDLV